MLGAKRAVVWSLLTSLALGVGSEVAAQSSNRTEHLRWTHPAPSQVEGYRVHYGSESRIYTSHIDVGIPSKDDSGAFVYDLEVPAADAVYVAVSAYDAQRLESVFSNEKLRTPPVEPLGQPGQPVPVLN